MRWDVLCIQNRKLTALSLMVDFSAHSDKPQQERSLYGPPPHRVGPARSNHAAVGKMFRSMVLYRTEYVLLLAAAAWLRNNKTIKSNGLECKERVTATTR